MPFLYGIIGAVIALGLFIGGVFAGWKAHAKLYRVTPREPTQAEKIELLTQEEEQKAWRMMRDYNVDRAYGMNRDPMQEAGGDAT